MQVSVVLKDFQKYGLRCDLGSGHREAEVCLEVVCVCVFVCLKASGYEGFSL